MILTFDTETTGKGDYKLPFDHPSQPRMVQLGAILHDANDRVVAELNLIIKPDGFTIPDEAANIHGITTDIAIRYGFPLRRAMLMFEQLCLMAETAVAHNFDYDDRIIRGEAVRLDLKPVIATFASVKSFCTMKTATPLCKLPGMRGFKWPTLQEAHQHFFNAPFDGAHDAMADVRACRRVYEALTKTSS